MFVPRKVKQSKQQQQLDNPPESKRRRLSQDSSANQEQISQSDISNSNDSSSLPAQEESSSAGSSRVAQNLFSHQDSQKKERSQGSSSRPKAYDRTSLLLLFHLLSPPNLLWWASRSHSAVSEFIEHIRDQTSRGSTSEVGAKPVPDASIHISRLSRLLSSLGSDLVHDHSLSPEGSVSSATQIKKLKSLSILSHLSTALQGLVEAGIPWFRLSGDGFRIHFSRSYLCALLQERFEEVTGKDRIVYLESIPPNVEDVLHVAGFVQTLLHHHQLKQEAAQPNDNEDQQEWQIYSVYEPTHPGSSRRNGSYPVPTTTTTILPTKAWIPGRAFLVLSHAEASNWLHQKFEWRLDRRKFKSDMIRKEDCGDAIEMEMGDAWTLRCLRLDKWLELKRQYLDLQHRRAQKRRTPITFCNNIGDVQTQRKRKSDDQVDSERHEEPMKCGRSNDLETYHPVTQTEVEPPWYRGTVLEMRLAAPTTTSEKPTWTVESIKQDLERKVPESIAYIHTDTSADIPTESTDTHPNLQMDATVKIMVRTNLPSQASTLLGKDPNLKRMYPKEEDAYYAKLPTKVRNHAHKRILAHTSLDQQDQDTPNCKNSNNRKDSKNKKRKGSEKRVIVGEQ